jgi:hypothetical protein
MVTVFKDLFKTSDVPFIVPIDKIIKRIKQGSSKKLIEQIRASTNKDERDRLKKKLPAILFAGEFSERNKEGLLNHSGLMVTDFDNFPDEDVYNEMFSKITQNPYVIFAFRGPSGNGIKAVVKIPQCDKFDHERYFKAFKKEFDFEYFDQSNCDVSRVCFESYDPEAFVNLDAETYSPKLIDDGYQFKEYVSYTPLLDEDKIIERIMQWNWKKDFVEGERNSFIFDIAGAFCEFGISESTAVGYILNNVVIGEFSESEAKTTIKNVYKKRSFNSRFFEDYTKKEKLNKDLKTKKKEEIQKEYDLTEEQYDEVKDKADHEAFWYFELDSKGKYKTKIDPLKYKYFLERSGFKKFFHNDSQKPTWVKIESNKVSETSTEKIKDFVLDYLLKNKYLKVWSYCVNYSTIFSENFLLMLETVDLMMLEDKKYKSFIAYENGILEVTKDKAELVDYIDVDGYIWKSQIIKRDFEPVSKNDNEYKTFISNISNKEPEPIEAVIGYLLSTYKNKMNNKAIILNDEVISENPEGGTGKGLFIQGLRQIRKVSILDGKTFDDKKSFPYQTVSQETQILVFDDVKKNWDFETKFSLVTEGMTLERKNKDAIKLTVEESPKMVVSTNYAIKGEGNSHDRRRHEIEIAQYYGKDLTPYDEFGKQLFDDWNEDEFNAFDNYMVYCLQLYLSKGLVKQNAKNLDMRKFIAETAMEFNEWISDGEHFPINKRNNKVEMFDGFILEYPDFKKWLTRKRFNIWVQKYASFKNFVFEQGNTNGIRWFQITDITKEIEEDNGIDF